jgi:2-polyprenyl-3-methyl-5-hydroxy-6-metoxy-1,4-benzoquinol methylase
MLDTVPSTKHRIGYRPVIVSRVDLPQARYDEGAELYEAMFGDSVEDPATAALLDLIGDVAGARVVDVPCGSGRVARQLARRGALVTGVDLSAALLERARAAEAATVHEIEYLHADATSADTLPGRVFDLVVCNYGLSDIDDLDKFLTSVARLLRPTGTFVFSILHPCFPGIPSMASPSWPPGGYHDERWWQSDGPASDLRRLVGSNHRTLSTYFNCLLAHGFVPEVLAEPNLALDLTGVVPTPMFLAARWRKIH